MMHPLSGMMHNESTNCQERQTHISLLGCFISGTPRFLSGCCGPCSWLLAPLHLHPDPLSKLILGLFARVLHPSGVPIAKAAQKDWSHSHQILAESQVHNLQFGSFQVQSACG